MLHVLQQIFFFMIFVKTGHKQGISYHIFQQNHLVILYQLFFENIILEKTGHKPRNDLLYT